MDSLPLFRGTSSCPRGWRRRYSRTYVGWPESNITTSTLPWRSRRVSIIPAAPCFTNFQTLSSARGTAPSHLVPRHQRVPHRAVELRCFASWPPSSRYFSTRYRRPIWGRNPVVSTTTMVRSAAQARHVKWSSTQVDEQAKNKNSCVLALGQSGHFSYSKVAIRRAPHCRMLWLVN